MYRFSGTHGKLSAYIFEVHRKLSVCRCGGSCEGSVCVDLRVHLRLSCVDFEYLWELSV